MINFKITIRPTRLYNIQKQSIITKKYNHKTKKIYNLHNTNDKTHPILISDPI